MATSVLGSILLGVGAALHAAGELNVPWTAVSAKLGSQPLGGASFLNGQYFVFGAGEGASSANGLDWTPFAAGSINGMNGGRPTFGAGVYVTGGGNTGGVIYTSGNGVQWSRVFSGTNGIVKGVVHNGTIFVAVSDRGGIVTSSDGRSWTSRYANPATDFYDVAVGTGRFVAVGFEIAHSTDGVSWTAVAAPVAPFTDIVFGDGKFVALAATRTGSEFWHSPDGVAWTRTTAGLPNAGEVSPSGAHDLAFGGDTFVAAIGRDLYVSDDGIAWRTTPGVFGTQTIYPISIGYGNGRFIAAGQAGSVWLSPAIAGAPKTGPITGPSYVLSGQAAALSIESGGPGLTLQWYRGTSGDVSQPISGATAANYVTPPLTQAQSYWVRTANSSSAADSATVTVKVATAPSLTTTQREFEVVAGDPIALAAVVTGDPVPNLQWYRGRRGDTSKPISGAHSSTFTLDAPSVVESYWLRASNMAGSMDTETFRVVPWQALHRSVRVANARSLGNVFVGLGGDTISQSTDNGRTWTRLGTLANSSLRDIAQGAGLYVAVGERGFYSSPDLRTWSRRNAPAFGLDRGATSIAFGKGRFVAVGSATSYVSSNGVDWSELELPAGVRFRAVLFDGRRFAAAGSMAAQTSAGSEAGVIFTSDDGLSWTQRAKDLLSEPHIGFPAALESIVYAAGRYLAFGSGAWQVLVSPDALNWSRVDVGILSRGRLRSIAYANRRFVLATSGDAYLTSEDGLVWTASAAPFPFAFEPVLVVAPSRELLAIGQTSFQSVIYASRDSLQWTLRRGSDDDLGMAYVTPGAGFVIGLRAAGSSPVYGSENAQNWAVLLPFSGGGLPRPHGRGAFFKGRFYHAAETGSQILASLDGVGWKAYPVAGTTRRFHRVVAQGGRLFALAVSGGLTTSTDGETWSTLLDPDRSYSDIAYANGVFVGVGLGREKATLTVSNDGIVWRPPTAADFVGPTLHAVVFGNGLFLAVGQNFSEPFFLTSTDGERWTKTVLANFSGSGGFQDAVFLGDRFFITLGASVMFSDDGVTWVAGPSGVGNSQLVVVNGAVFRAGSLLRAVDESAVSIASISADTEITSGQIAQISVAATGPGLQYQWLEIGGDLATPIPGANSATFTTPPITSNRRFAVRVTGTNGTVESRRVLVAVAGPPTIAVQPFSTDLLPGNLSGMLDVEVESVPPVRYQWFVGERGDTRAPIFGANAKSYSAPTFEYSARYWVRATNVHGSVDSAAALVTPWSVSEIATSSGQFRAIGLAVGNAKTVATGLLFPPGGGFSSAVAVSADGRQWAVSSAPRLGIAAFGAGRFVAANEIGNVNTLYASPDGVTWTNVFVDSVNPNFTNISFVGGRFVAIGATGRIAISEDGVSWTGFGVGPGPLKGIAFGNGRYVIGGLAGRVYTSTDASTWRAVTAGGSSDVSGVAFAAGRFVVSTADGALFTSIDAAQWAPLAVQTWNRTNTLPAGFAIRAMAGCFWGSASGTINSAFVSLDGVRWGPSVQGTQFASDESDLVALTGGLTVMRAKLEAALALLAPPTSQFVNAGGTATLSAIASGSSPISFQWHKDGVPVAGATYSALYLPEVTASMIGHYTVTVANASGRTTSRGSNVSLGNGTFEPTPIASWLVNLSLLTSLTSEAPQFKLGTVIHGRPEDRKPLVIRAVGPTLAVFGVANPLADPKVDVLRNSALVAANDNWGGGPSLANAMAAVGAFPFLHSDSRDASLAPALAPGDYVMDISGVGSGLGPVLAEIYDATPRSTFTPGMARLINASVLKPLGSGLTAGFVITGEAERTLLVRAIGPGLIQFGVPQAVADPKLELFNSNSKLIDGNNDWGGTHVLRTTFAQTGAFKLDDASADAVLLVTLNPGSYTIQVSGAGNASGSVLVEIYDVR